MLYHVIIIRLHEPLRSPADDADEDEFTRMLVLDAKRRCTQAAVAIAHLMRLHHDAWGTAHIPVSNSHWCTLALLMLLDDLATAEGDAAFVELCVCLRAAARRWLLAKGMLRLVQVTARHYDVRLPEATTKLFEDFENHSWDPAVDGAQLSSLYPNLAVPERKRDGSPVEMDRFLKKWDNLSLATEKMDEPESSSSR